MAFFVFPHCTGLKHNHTSIIITYHTSLLISLPAWNVCISEVLGIQKVCNNCSLNESIVIWLVHLVGFSQRQSSPDQVKQSTSQGKRQRLLQKAFFYNSSYCDQIIDFDVFGFSRSIIYPLCHIS